METVGTVFNRGLRMVIPASQMNEEEIETIAHEICFRGALVNCHKSHLSID
jgi:hypothetical protein